MTRYFISDTHFSHRNIIKFCSRPFSNEHEMDEALVANWNAVVKPQDHITHLGDVTMNRGGRVQQEAFIRLIGRLNGHKRLYLGNHDHFPIETYLRAGFEKIYATWRDESGLLFSHIPIHPKSLGSARANVHGHIHEAASYPTVVATYKDGSEHIKPYINISVEMTGYAPISIDEIEARIKATIEGA